MAALQSLSTSTHRRGLTISQELWCAAALAVVERNVDNIFDFSLPALLHTLVHLSLAFVGVPLLLYTAPPVPRRNRGFFRKTVDISGYSGSSWFFYTKMGVLLAISYSLKGLQPDGTRHRNEALRKGGNIPLILRILLLSALIGLIASHYWTHHGIKPTAQREERAKDLNKIVSMENPTDEK